MKHEYLSDTHLYFSESVDLPNRSIKIEGEEARHITSVMRFGVGSEVNITDGKGTIYHSEITGIMDKGVTAKIIKETKYENCSDNLTFCIPLMKNPDRFEFALEKCVELGITSFLVNSAETSIKKSFKAERWKKITIAAMKQSLRAYLPDITTIQSLKAIKHLKGEKIVFDQKCEKQFSPLSLNPEEHHFLIFGPESGFSRNEYSDFDGKDFYNLTPNRLRTETAIILTAGLITLNIS